MLNDKVVLEYGLRKMIDFEEHFLTKLKVYHNVANGKAKTLIERLLVDDGKHFSKLQELLKTLEKPH